MPSRVCLLPRSLVRDRPPPSARARNPLALLQKNAPRPRRLLHHTAATRLPDRHLGLHHSSRAQVRLLWPLSPPNRNPNPSPEMPSAQMYTSRVQPGQVPNSRKTTTTQFPLSHQTTSLVYLLPSRDDTNKQLSERTTNVFFHCFSLFIS